MARFTRRIPRLTNALSSFATERGSLTSSAASVVEEVFDFAALKASAVPHTAEVASNSARLGTRWALLITDAASFASIAPGSACRRAEHVT
jgi:hypothetical protein